MNIYTTYFDSNYFVRGITVIESLISHTPGPYRIRVIALDDACAENLPRYFSNLPTGVELSVLRISELEAQYSDLAAAKGNRSRTEYIFTLTPFVCLNALKQAGHGEFAVYFDADMLFFTDANLALAEVGTHDAAITGHRFPAYNRHLELYGLYNVGWMAFRNSQNAFDLLELYRGQCIEYCGVEPTEVAYGDQKYLDTWPDSPFNVTVVDHVGVNTGPWNAVNYTYSGQPGSPQVDTKPLIIFHFHRLRKLYPKIYEASFGKYGAFPPSLRPIYAFYLDTLARSEAKATSLGIPVERSQHVGQQAPKRRYSRLRKAARQIASGTRLLFKNGRPLSLVGSLLYVR